MSFITENYVAIIMVLLALSEGLALFPGIKANSVFQLIVNLLKSLVPAKKE